MGKRDNRRSMKLRRKTRQKKPNTRLKRRKAGRAKASAGSKPAKTAKARPAAAKE